MTARAALLLAALGAALLGGGCAGRDHPSSRPQPPAVKIGDRETGYASWYGPDYHGRSTASGERYNMFDLTAAHRTLPFGTLVRVENLATSQEVIVRINDRGPFVRGRIIDLSYKAARAIGISRRGSIKVRVEVVSVPRAA